MDKIQNNILNIAHNNYEYLISLENVVGIGLGNKIINGINTLEPCIHVLVEKKVNVNSLSKNNIIPKNYMGIKTDVINIGKMISCNDEGLLPDKIRPLEGGYGISNELGGTGTLGCIVKKTKKNKVDYYILSNNHVMAGYNKFPIGTSIFQPSIDDGGKQSDVVAKLSDFIRLKFKNKVFKPINYVDCAIAKIIDPKIITNKIAYAGKLKGVAKPEIGLDVIKTGTTSGTTYGNVETIGTSIEIGYDKNTKKAFFKDQIIAYIESEPGDSGSVLVNTKDEAIGLLVSGKGNNYTIFNDINNVIKKLKVELYTG